MAGEIKILCVDDEKNVLKALRRLFMEEENYEILLAESGQEGLAVLEEEEDIRLIISDYRMPEMNGVEFLRQVNERWPETIRIVLSGFADTAAVVEAINLGQIYKFLPKPWNDEDLLSTIGSALDHQSLRWENNKLSQELKIRNAELKQVNAELQSVNEHLEDLVELRTEELEIRHRVLKISQAILDVLPVAVLGIDPDDMIVHCNQAACDLFPSAEMGPLGHDRSSVLSAEVNQLIDQLSDGFCPNSIVTIRERPFRCQVRRLHETLSQGCVVVLSAEH